MSNKNNLFKPARRQIGFWCVCILLGIIVNVHYLLSNGNLALYVSLVLLVGIFVILFMPFLKNQKVVVSGDEICLFTFGRINRLKFCGHIKEIVVKEKEIVSYRFEKDGNNYQISPKAYYDSQELELLFNNLNKKCGNVVSVVQK